MLCIITELESDDHSATWHLYYDDLWCDLVRAQNKIYSIKSHHADNQAISTR